MVQMFALQSTDWVKNNEIKCCVDNLPNTYSKFASEASTYTWVFIVQCNTRLKWSSWVWSILKMTDLETNDHSSWRIRSEDIPTSWIREEEMECCKLFISELVRCCCWLPWSFASTRFWNCNVNKPSFKELNINQFPSH